VMILRMVMSSLYSMQPLLTAIIHLKVVNHSSMHTQHNILWAPVRKIHGLNQLQGVYICIYVCMYVSPRLGKKTFPAWRSFELLIVRCLLLPLECNCMYSYNVLAKSLCTESFTVVLKSYVRDGVCFVWPELSISFSL
jgi:hypothetical protein